MWSNCKGATSAAFWLFTRWSALGHGLSTSSAAGADTVELLWEWVIAWTHVCIAQRFVLAAAIIVNSYCWCVANYCNCLRLRVFVVISRILWFSWVNYSIQDLIMGVGMQINGYLSVNTSKCEKSENYNLQCMRLVASELFHIIIEMCYLS